MRGKWLLLCALVAACGTGTVGRPKDGGGDVDLTFSFSDDGGGQGCDDQHPCPMGKMCFEGQCLPDNGTCMTDDECQNDTYCDCLGGGGPGPDMGPCLGGVCIPYGYGPRGPFDPDCQGAAFSAGQFVAPKLKCKYDVGSPQVLTTPVLADLDGDKKPEIIFSGYPNRFVAIHGDNCGVWFDKNFDFGDGSQSELAVADLDGDKVPEIIGVDSGNRLIVMDNKGNLLATSPTPAGAGWSAPAVADVDGKAPPEIIVGGQVARYTKGQNALAVVWNVNVPQAPIGYLDSVADMDGDGKPEVIAAGYVYDGLTGADKTPPALAQQLQAGGAAFTATGDFNKDKKPEIVLVQPGRVSVFDFAKKAFIFGPFQTMDTAGGAPVVADFDGDGVPDFGTAGNTWYYAFALKCDPKAKAPQCDQQTNFGVLWKKKTQDLSSGVTSSSVFDFNGDGKAEVVYRDECWLRVYNGVDGKTVFAASVTSVTCTEEVVVADVDNDGHADLIVPSDNIDPNRCNGPEADTNTPQGPATSGVLVFQDPMNRWMPSRSVWNQNTYHITNINDDGTVPIPEKDNWLTWNNYRQNTQGQFQKPGPKADFTGGAATLVDGAQPDCKSMWILYANICNRGTAMVAPGVPGTFYSSDPRNGNAMPICTAATTMTLNPGDCETVQCTWNNPPQMPTDLWFRADDDGHNMPDTECKGMNDLLIMPQAQCNSVG